MIKSKEFLAHVGGSWVLNHMLYSTRQHHQHTVWLKMNIQTHLQFECTIIEVVVLFAEKIPQYSGGVTTADLVG